MKAIKDFVVIAAMLILGYYLIVEVDILSLDLRQGDAIVIVEPTRISEEPTWTPFYVAPTHAPQPTPEIIYSAATPNPNPTYDYIGPPVPPNYNVTATAFCAASPDPDFCK